MPGQSCPTITCPHCKARHVHPSGALEDGVYASHCVYCGQLFKLRAVGSIRSQFNFTINGKSYTVDKTTSGGLTLNRFLRGRGISCGTKEMCHEAGCGCCVVTASFTDHVTNQAKTISINSCLCPLYIVEGWSITTIEGLGSQSAGYHPIQERLADYNGTQCGFCSPGMVMNMYGFLQNKANPTMAEVEEHMDGNICRCTGYRPILDAMKSFAKDAPHHQNGQSLDIEDLKPRVCSSSGQPCHSLCAGQNDGPLQIVFASSVWYKPTTMTDLYTLLKQHANDKVRLVFGNTASGIFKNLWFNNYDTLIDIRDIPDLSIHNIGGSVVLGANISLANTIILLREASQNASFSYCSLLADHLCRVGNVHLRNAGCWAGNLMMKHMTATFPSDVYVLLATVGAQLNIGSADTGQITKYSMTTFLSLDMTKKVIISVELPALASGVVVRTYKIMPRTVNTHAYVNAGFMLPVDTNNNCRFTAKPNLVFGGISGTFAHATNTEEYLVGKALGDVATLTGALQSLQTEIVPNDDPILASVEYRKSLALSLFYKTALTVCGNQVSTQKRSGAANLVRPVSSAHQDFPTKQSEWPLTKAIPKLAAHKQTAGEAVYINDIPLMAGELHAAFVTSTVGNAHIQSVDASAALKLPGVVRFLSATDIPGQNNCFPRSYSGEELFCSSQVSYAGQPIGLIVAESQRIADTATRMVKVTYSNVQSPLVDIREAIRQNSFYTENMPSELRVGDAEGAIAAAANQLTGDVQLGGQYHFQMETMICLTVPSETGLMVYPATQWIDQTQEAISKILNVKQNTIYLEVTRLGGSYGSKLTRSFPTSCASALAAYLLKRPVKLMMNFRTNMETIGKRPSYYAQYSVGTTAEGLLKGIKLTYYSECGATRNDQIAGDIKVFGDNVYYCPNWHTIPKGVKMNTPPTTFARGPGAVPSIFVMETIMEHVAKSLGKDPTAVKTLNMYQKGQKTPVNIPLTYCSIRTLTSSLETSAQITTRRTAVTAFNQANRWKKRGLAVVPSKYVMSNSANYNALVSIYHGDGSVAVTHAGIENGQGINTKVAQVCAYELGIPLDQVQVLSTNSSSNANTAVTGGSTTSELNCKAAIGCCSQLNARIAPVKALHPTATWPQLIAICHGKGIDLSAKSWEYGDGHIIYNCYGVTCSEVELDVLTGEYMLLRTDILYDCGESMNPEIDIGQVEGAFVMGLGLWLTEKLRFNPQTGQLLTSSTWDYTPPMAKDIPIDFRVSLLKNAPNPVGVLRSKAVGEPPLCMSCSAVFALKHAIEAARKDLGQTGHFPLNTPASVENVQQQCMLNVSQLVYQ